MTEPMVATCTFDLAWSGPCGKPLPCKHDQEVCSGTGCRKPAVRQCPEAGSLVCGAPLCQDCHHVGLWGHGRNG